MNNHWCYVVFIGVYVKIALIGHGKVINKGKTKLIQPATPNPVFDEMITFTLPSNMIEHSCIIISVNGKTSHGKRSHIGYVSLGPPFFSAGSGLEQWTKMLLWYENFCQRPSLIIPLPISPSYTMMIDTPIISSSHVSLKRIPKR